MQDSFERVIERIAKESMFPYDQVYMIYSATGDEPETIRILTTAKVCNEDPLLFVAALNALRIERDQTLKPSLWENLKRLYSRVVGGFGKIKKGGDNG